MTNKGATVVLDHTRQLVGGPRRTGHPARELVVPHAVVATEQLPVRLREVRDLVATRERERALLWLRSILSTFLNQPTT